MRALGKWRVGEVGDSLWKDSLIRSLCSEPISNSRSKICPGKMNQKEKDVRAQSVINCPKRKEKAGVASSQRVRDRASGHDV